jgi:hypothetical protein
MNGWLHCDECTAYCPVEQEFGYQSCVECGAQIEELDPDTYYEVYRDSQL